MTDLFGTSSESAAGDPEQAADRVLELAEGRQLAGRLAENATARLGEQFEIRGMVRDLDALYSETR